MTRISFEVSTEKIPAALSTLNVRSLLRFLNLVKLPVPVQEFRTFIYIIILSHNISRAFRLHLHIIYALEEFSSLHLSSILIAAGIFYFISILYVYYALFLLLIPSKILLFIARRDDACYNRYTGYPRSPLLCMRSERKSQVNVRLPRIKFIYNIINKHMHIIILIILQ